MNKFFSRRLLAIVVIAVSFSCGPAMAADGWMPNLWPWGKSKPTHRQATKTPLKRVTDGTKEAISDTGEFLMPWRKKKKATNPYEGAGNFFRPDLAHRKKDKSMWEKWFGEEEDDAAKPLSVPEWMAQERPGFERR